MRIFREWVEPQVPRSELSGFEGKRRFIPSPPPHPITRSAQPGNTKNSRVCANICRWKNKQQAWDVVVKLRDVVAHCTWILLLTPTATAPRDELSCRIKVMLKAVEKRSWGIILESNHALIITLDFWPFSLWAFRSFIMFREINWCVLFGKVLTLINNIFPVIRKTMQKAKHLTHRKGSRCWRSIIKGLFWRSTCRTYALLFSVWKSLSRLLPDLNEIGAVEWATMTRYKKQRVNSQHVTSSKTPRGARITQREVQKTTPWYNL